MSRAGQARRGGSGKRSGEGIPDREERVRPNQRSDFHLPRVGSPLPAYPGHSFHSASYFLSLVCLLVCLFTAISKKTEDLSGSSSPQLQMPSRECHTRSWGLSSNCICRQVPALLPSNSHAFAELVNSTLCGGGECGWGAVAKQGHVPHRYSKALSRGCVSSWE